MNKEILCTLGPASMNDKVISRLEDLGVSLFRINLSHMQIENVESMIDFIQSRSKVPICLDTEGAQIRTGHFAHQEIVAAQDAMIRASYDSVEGNETEFNFYPRECVQGLREGDLISIDFNGALAHLIHKGKDHALLQILNPGKIGSNKAVTVHRAVALNVLTDKDKAAIKIGMRKGLRHVALSFANAGSDVDYIRSLCKPGTFIISKVECRQALIHLDDITAKSDAILIDRGDLSREEPIERIPYLQKMITKRAKSHGKKVYVATNLLESMIASPGPTRAEVNDVVNTLNDGADGLVLAAETAIGKDPVGCAWMIVKLIHEFERGISVDEDYYPVDVKSSLMEPHGGKLIRKEVSGDSRSLGKLPFLMLSLESQAHCAYIGNGTYSPLEGFMDEVTLKSVLSKRRLPSGQVWAKPILLPRGNDLKNSCRAGQTLALKSEQGQIIAVMQVTQIFQYENQGYVAGSIECLSAAQVLRERHLTPANCRTVFMHKNWQSVVGVFVNGDPHFPQTDLVKEIKNQYPADGVLFCHLAGDAAGRRSSLAAAVDGGLFSSLELKLNLGAEADVLHAVICLKNMGCSHVVLPPAAQVFADSIQALGLTPIEMEMTRG
jgi:pyruvate kinase